jgi:hypothetical protein
VHETAAELERLQRLLDESAERAGPFLRSSFQIPERSLSAGQLAERLPGPLTVALATTTARGEPRGLRRVPGGERVARARPGCWTRPL